MSRRAVVHALTAMAGLALGCGGPELPPLAFESAHFRFHADPEKLVCPRLGEWLEAHYAALGGYLGVALSDGDAIDVYDFRDRDTFVAESPCSDEEYGCAGGLSVYLYSLDVLEHELVHVYAGLLGRSPTLFDEGLAIMLQESNGWSILAKPPKYASTPLETVLESEAWAEAADHPAGAAGSFVRFLVDRHGIGSLAAFQGSTTRDAGLAAIADAFAGTMGEPIEAALAAWRAGPADTLGVGWLPVARCAAPPLPTDGSVALGPMPCGRDRFSFDLASPASVVVRARHDGFASAGIESCSGGYPLWPAGWSLVTSTDEQHELWAALPSGSYFLEAGAFTHGADVAVPDISVEWGPHAATACGSAGERLVPAATELVTLPVSFETLGDAAGAPSLRDLFVRFRLEAPRHVEVRPSPPDPLAGSFFDDGLPHETSVSLCDAGCPPATCTPLLASGADLTAGDTHVLLLEGAPTDRRTFSLYLAP